MITASTYKNEKQNMVLILKTIEKYRLVIVTLRAPMLAIS